MVSVDKTKCIGCGVCASVCPDGFKLGADGKAEVVNGSAGCVDQAKASCPTQAIQ